MNAKVYLQNLYSSITERYINKISNDSSPELIAYHLLELYRDYGHQIAKLDPLELDSSIVKESVFHHPSYNCIQSLQSSQAKVTLKSYLPTQNASIQEYAAILKQTYAGTIGYEASHLSIEKREWLFEKIESKLSAPIRTCNHKVERLRALDKLLEATLLETSLSNRFPGMKRFAISGSDAFIPLIDRIILSAIVSGVKNFNIGMAHRGRIATYGAIMDMPYDMLYAEFLGKNTFNEYYGLEIGDRKYHMPFESTKEILGRKISASILGNPSHLESVFPVTLGVTRAMQDASDDAFGLHSLAIIVHGDAAMSGQGVVQESLQLSNTNGYSTKGSIHIVINNQIGFTTNPEDDRSSLYCTDIAKMINAPVFHVNSTDLDAVIAVAKLASEYRSTFHQDCVIDLVGYREYGHNEGDDPAFTQPVMYQAIKNLKEKPISEMYANILIQDKVLSREMLEIRKSELSASLDEAYDRANSSAYKLQNFYNDLYKNYSVRYEDMLPVAGISAEAVAKFSEILHKTPENFKISDKLQKLIERRRTAITEDKIDWATAESLSFASILTAKCNIRMSGQDSQRGTFSQRHSVWHDQANDNLYIPLQNISDSGEFRIYNSTLSEFGVLNFEFGYSYQTPKDLVIWEAQFGDFANTAQVAIDQYIAGGMARWGNKAKLTVLLPHGYEGEAAEHSSGRIERFLQLASDNNMIICNCTTPASYFHLLRRQALSAIAIPLIVFTPKSLLRNKMATSTRESLNEANAFSEIIIHNISDMTSCKKIILCSGKIYYELYAKINELNMQKEIALLAIEQLYPFPLEQLLKLCGNTKNKQIVWCQEEPQNMGAYLFVKNVFDNNNIKIRYAGRSASPVTACALSSIHTKEQNELIATALA